MDRAEYAPTEPPEGVRSELVHAARCTECEVEIYQPKNQNGTPKRWAPSICRDCYIDDLTELPRTDAIRRLVANDLLPVRDFLAGGRFLVDAEVKHNPEGGDYVALESHITEADEGDECERCGYDRFVRSRWSLYDGVEHGEETECRACGHTVDYHSTL